MYTHIHIRMNCVVFVISLSSPAAAVRLGRCWCAHSPLPLERGRGEGGGGSHERNPRLRNWHKSLLLPFLIRFHVKCYDLKMPLSAGISSDICRFKRNTHTMCAIYSVRIKRLLWLDNGFEVAFSFLGYVRREPSLGPFLFLRHFYRTHTHIRRSTLWQYVNWEIVLTEKFVQDNRAE